MKKSLFLYLFILAVLMNVFTYMYFSKETAFEQERNTKISKRLGDSLTSVNSKLADAGYFSLEKNDNAQNYFENNATGKYIPYQKLIPYVTEKLMDFNTNPKGNPYTGQEQLGAQKFIINKAKILNHRWIIADYNDGKYWGEVLLKYFINENESVSFEVIQSIIYQQ
ncbi:hypothetical protein FNO01nite_18910 [Flavobacterium noncentrifugens]|uniref:Hydrolase n=1 Tax=Flavobacterium noncentrifugens TaxID=1128970 RepID=A0A1G8YGX9_9FLAO|nr:hypothetical protein [Flavobacterium noncentrifugens]GEP51219.1 hypothetical protein FNO01nite_18910 [Flavobacterium noncentrifugens]SDK01996.1 hypothetical protein SAMN04487935_2326 [Flavobacterium noncentrifugens]